MIARFYQVGIGPDDQPVQALLGLSFGDTKEGRKRPKMDPMHFVDLLALDSTSPR